MPHVACFPSGPCARPPQPDSHWGMGQRKLEGVMMSLEVLALNLLQIILWSYLGWSRLVFLFLFRFRGMMLSFLPPPPDSLFPTSNLWLALCTQWWCSWKTTFLKSEELDSLITYLLLIYFLLALLLDSHWCSEFFPLCGYSSIFMAASSPGS